MEDSIVSVIIPVFNVEPYLAPCIDSVLNQSHRQLEVIIINDGSSDFSMNIAEKYAEKDSRVTAFSHSHGGPSSARNHGIEAATGDYIMFVDSDDILLPNAVEILLSVLLEKDADLVEGETVRGRVYKEYYLPKSLKTKTYSTREALTDVLYQKNLIPSVCGKIFRKHLFDDLRFKEGIFYEDLDLFCRILSRCQKIVWINIPVYFYRITEGSIINSWKPKRLDVLKVTEDIEKYISEEFPEVLSAAKARRLSANFNMFALCSINGDPENATKCWQHIKENRKNSLLDPKVRLKNKSGALLSYFGRYVFEFVSRFVYK
ncbi:MAG: glycosyltransferase family 2 protein [Muribaculaceae bacterium]|nr:glycosyltransferase family 2 protein [Muribaculaceae bacterium]